MGIIERKQRARADLRRLILATAEELFVRHGFENVSMRKIAARMEYSPTTIYHYFKDKGELFFYLLESYHRALRRRMDRIYRTEPDPLRAVRKGMRTYTEFGLANPSYYKLAFNSPPEFKAGSYLAEGQEGTLLFHGLRTSVEKCIRKGLFRQMDVDLAAQTIWMMNHGVTSLLLSNPNFPWRSRAALIQGVIDCAIAGLQAGPASATAAAKERR
jgi:AcrR family transcriptional regulator